MRENNIHEQILVLHIALILASFVNTQENVYVRPGGTVELKCQNKSNTNDITWFGPQVVSPISKGRTIHWNSADNRMSITALYNLRISRFINSDIGKYKCILTTERISYQHEFNLLLEIPPKDLRITSATTNNTIYGKEGKELTIQCKVKTGLPRGHLVWIHKGQNLKQSQSGDLNYTFKPKKKDHLSQYTCKTITSTLVLPLFQTVTLIVYYAPRVFLKKKASQMKITEGQSLTIRCDAEALPDLKNFTWTKMDQLIAALPTLYIDVVNRKDAGIYTCSAMNLIGAGNIETDVVVFYPPDVTIKYKNYTEGLKREMLSCYGNGIPDTYRFYEWEHTSNYGDHIRFLNGSTNGSLVLPNSNGNEIEYQNNGYYKCTVSNGIPNIYGVTKQSSEVFLYVQGKPMFVHDNVDRIYGEYRKTVSIDLNIYSNPKYTDFGIFDGNGNRLTSVMNIKIIEETRSVLATFHGSVVRVKGYKITFNLEMMTQEYFTDYIFKVTNNFGQSHHNTTVIRASSPSLPLNVTILPISNGAQISWIRNFNGGFNQTFFIDYHIKDDNIWITIQSKNSTNSRKIAGTINNLHPGYLYVFRMFARNKIGDSNKTEEIVVKIPVETKADSIQSLFLIAVSGSSLVGFILMSAIVLFVIKRLCPTQRQTEVQHGACQTYNIECGPYDEIDEQEMEDDLRSNNETETVIDSEYELPCNLLPHNVQSVDNQKSISSASSVKSEEIDGNETFAKDICINSYEQLTENRDLPLPYDCTA